MKRGPVVRSLVAGFGLALLPAAVDAQGGPPLVLTVVPADLLFPTPTDASFDMGWVDHGGVTVSVSPRNPNRPGWQLFISALAADMGGYGKPVQDILFRVQGSGTWTPLNTVDQLVAQGSGDTTITIYFRLGLSWEADLPGSYSVPFEISGRAL